MTGKAELTLAAIGPALALFDMGTPLRLTSVVYMTRAPQTILKYDKIVRPFPLNVWLMVIICCSLQTTVMYIIYKTHMTEKMKDHKLVKEEPLLGNILLFCFTKIVEPDALPWFQKWSSGKISYFVWMIYATFIVFFYTSNLRAHLVYIDYEKAPQGLKDIYERGQTVYQYGSAIRQR